MVLLVYKVVLDLSNLRTGLAANDQIDHIFPPPI